MNTDMDIDINTVTDTIPADLLKPGQILALPRKNLHQQPASA